MKNHLIITLLILFVIQINGQILSDNIEIEIDYYQLAKDCLEVDTGFSESELKKLQKRKDPQKEYYIGDAIKARVIILGKTIQREDNGKYILEVNDVIKGKGLVAQNGNMPKTMKYYGDGGVAGTSEPVMNRQGVYFFESVKKGNILYRIYESTILNYDNILIYEMHFSHFYRSLTWTSDILKNNKYISNKMKLMNKYHYKIYFTEIKWDEAINNIIRTLDKDDPINLKKYKNRVHF